MYDDYAVDTIVYSYHSNNSFFTREADDREYQYIPSDITIWPSIIYSDIVGEQPPTTPRKAATDIIEHLTLASLHGTIVSLSLFDRTSLHCGVVDNVLYIRKVPIDVSNKLESLFLRDIEMGRFVLENVSRTDDGYVRAVDLLEELRKL